MRPIKNNCSPFLFISSIVFAFMSMFSYNYEIYYKEITCVFPLTEKNHQLIKTVKLDDADNPFRFVLMCSYTKKFRDIPIRVIIKKTGEQLLDKRYYPAPAGVGGTTRKKSYLIFYNYGKFSIPEEGLYEINISAMSNLYNFNEFIVNINKSSNSTYVVFHFFSVVFFSLSIVYRKTTFKKGVLRIIPYFFLLLIGIAPLLYYVI